MTSFAPAGFFDRTSTASRPPIDTRSNRPNAGPNTSSPAAIRSSGDVAQRRRPWRRRRARCRRCRGRGAACRTRRSPSGVREREVGAVEAVERDARRGHVERRAARSRRRGTPRRRGARGTRRRSCSRSPQTPHHFESAAWGRRRQRDARVVDPVRERSRRPAGQPGHERVVGVSDEPPRAGGRDPPPTGGDGLELAVAVELVAEQVPEPEHPRGQRRRHVLERGLVDLEDAEVGAAAREQRRGDARGEVRAGGVAAQPPLGLEHGREHLRGGGLAVRRRDHNGAAGDPARQPRDGVGSHPQEQLARQARPAACPRTARQPGGRACCGDLGGEDDHPPESYRRPSTVRI